METDNAWDRFYAKSQFKPNYYERATPAITEPSPSVTFDLDRGWSDQFLDSAAVEFATAFKLAGAPGERLMFLDWQHPCYWFEPHVADPEGPLPVLPDGDYYIFLDPDLRFGTFGHPWQLSLTVFGARLLSALDNRSMDVLGTVGWTVDGPST